MEGAPGHDWWNRFYIREKDQLSAFGFSLQVAVRGFGVIGVKNFRRMQGNVYGLGFRV